MATACSHDLDGQLARFGLSSFRTGQKEVISAVLRGQDCLCIMPTGGGKSLCYQLPALLREGVTLVVSPLIALMKDQVDALNELGIRATLINSSISLDEQHERLQRMASAEFDLVYVAPERFRSARFLQALGSAGVHLLAVDEAHCISEWGHDFRPDYARLGHFRQQLGNPQTIALTATATPAVRQDVIDQLRLTSPESVITGFARPNLVYKVQSCSSRGEKDNALLEVLSETPGSGIVYVSSRDRCQRVADLIASRTGRSTGVYHAGLDGIQREMTQEHFMNGRCQVVVATVAFGMGIDKADVRFVVHYNMPGSLESYYQEAGRAGRDGLPSWCVLLYGFGDRRIQEFFIESAYPPRKTVGEVYEFFRGLDSDPIELTQQQVKEQLGLELGADAVGACEKLLETSEVLERLEARQNMASVQLDSDLGSLLDLLPAKATVQRKVMRAVQGIVGARRFERVYIQLQALAEALDMDPAASNRALRDLTKLEVFDYIPPFRGRAVRLLHADRSFDELDIDFQQYDRRKEAEYKKLDHVIRYAHTTRCRQLEILRYFGEVSPPRCGHCDNCHQVDQDGGVADAVEISSQDDPLLLAIQIVLSGVARINQRFANRQMGFGKQTVAQMLCGSSSAKIAKWKLDELSTFGLLSYLTQADVVRMIDGLIGMGLLAQTDVDRFKPVLALTEEGVEAMRGTDRVDMALRLPRSLVDKIRPRGPASEGSQRSVRVHASEAIPAGSHGHPPGDGVQPGYYWTWRLLDGGFSPAECAAIRGLDETVIWDHAQQAVESGLNVDPGWLLSSEQIVAIDLAMGTEGSDRIRPLLNALPPGIRYEQVQFLVKCRAAGLGAGA